MFFAWGKNRPEKTEGAVVLIPSSQPLSIIAHQLLILDLGGVVPVSLFQLSGVHLHLSSLRELSDDQQCEWQCSSVSQSDTGSEERGIRDVLLVKKPQKGNTGFVFCCRWCLNNSCMHCFLLAELSLLSVPGLFSMISLIWHFIFRLDFHGWDSIIKRVRSIRMNMVFLQLFQTYRFPKKQQGTGNQGVLCVTVYLSPPHGKYFFSGHSFFCNNYCPYFCASKCKFFQVFFCTLSRQKITFLHDGFEMSSRVSSRKYLIFVARFPCLDSIWAAYFVAYVIILTSGEVPVYFYSPSRFLSLF